MKFTVTFGLDADNNEDAQEIVGSWTVTPGTMLYGITPVPEALPPAVIDAGGSVATAIARAKAPSTPSTAAPIPPPPAQSKEDPDA